MTFIARAYYTVVVIVGALIIRLGWHIVRADRRSSRNRFCANSLLRMTDILPASLSLRKCNSSVDDYSYQDVVHSWAS
jgi:hypothetical protein